LSILARHRLEQVIYIIAWYKWCTVYPPTGGGVSRGADISLRGFHPLRDKVLSQNLQADQGCHLEGSSFYKETAYRGVYCIMQPCVFPGRGFGIILLQGRRIHCRCELHSYVYTCSCTQSLLTCTGAWTLGVSTSRVHVYHLAIVQHTRSSATMIEQCSIVWWSSIS
jgi:hypothetical protein